MSSLAENAKYVLELWSTPIHKDMRVVIFMAMMCVRTGLNLDDVVAKIQELADAG